MPYKGTSGRMRPHGRGGHGNGPAVRTRIGSAALPLVAAVVVCRLPRPRPSPPCSTRSRPRRHRKPPGHLRPRPSPAVPDSGSRPIPLGTLVMPGQVATDRAGRHPRRRRLTDPVPSASKMQSRDRHARRSADPARSGPHAGRPSTDHGRAEGTRTPGRCCPRRRPRPSPQPPDLVAGRGRDAARRLRLRSAGPRRAGRRCSAATPASEQSAARHIALAQAAMSAAQSDADHRRPAVARPELAVLEAQAEIATKQAALTEVRDGPRQRR